MQNVNPQDVSPIEVIILIKNESRQYYGSRELSIRYTQHGAHIDLCIVYLLRTIEWLIKNECRRENAIPLFRSQSRCECVYKSHL